MPAIIAENDESQWDDQTGIAYHFPKRYAPDLAPGTDVIYYKGKLTDRRFRESRLTDLPHYFGAARIGNIYPDRKSSKGDLFAVIEGYRAFSKPVHIRLDGDYLETILPSRRRNHFRFAVRQIDPSLYQLITSLGHPEEIDVPAFLNLGPGVEDNTQAFESAEEGAPTKRYSTVYERNPRLRRLAILIHGLECQTCGFDFARTYGDYGAGFIHVHHLQPLGAEGAARHVNPKTDLAVLCANCHAIIHRHSNRTLTLAELREMMDESKGLNRQG
jgi:predicted HNH restriction endonuclease